MSKPERISSLIRNSIANGEFGEKSSLPGSRKLSKLYGVSRGTIVRALDILKSEGLVEPKPKSGTFFGSERLIARLGAKTQSASAKRKAETVADDIAELISEGELGVGDYLPYQKSLLATYRVSRNTIRSAIGILAKRELIRRKGTSWIIGRRVLQDSPSRQTVLIYDYLVGMERRGVSFFSSFEKELLRHQVALTQSKVFRSTRIPEGPKRMVSGKMMGLTIFNTASWARYELNGSVGRLRQELRMLGRFGVPVVLNRAGPILDDFPGFSFRPYRSLYAIGEITANIGVDLAVFLYSMGHRKIGFLNFTNQAWAAERFLAFRNAIKKIGMGDAELSLFGANSDVLRQTEPLRSESEKILTNMNKMIAETVGGFRFTRMVPTLRAAATLVSQISLNRHLEGMIPICERALSNKDISAWVCADPTVAFAAHDFLKTRGIDVPVQISLASFDDNEFTTRYRITAYDSQVDRLGYLAAHCLLGDIPIKRDKNGFVECPGQIIDRGSVGRPA